MSGCFKRAYGDEKKMIPEIDIRKWHYELDISIDDIADLVNLFAFARRDNMLVNEMINRMVRIVRYQNQVANILGVSPSMVSLRIHNRAGITDRVLAYPSIPNIEHVLRLFNISESLCKRIVEICEDIPLRYLTPDAFTDLLHAFSIYSKADVITEHLFY